MVDRESLQNYQPPTPGVVSVDGHRLTLYCGDDLPEIGHAIAVIGPDDRCLWAIVERHAGARRVEAWTPVAPDWLRPELAIELTDRAAAFDFNPEQTVRPGAQMVRPQGDDGDAIVLWPQPPRWVDLDPRRTALSLGIEAVDVLAPIATGGVNLIVDTTTNTDAFGYLSQRVFDALSPEAAVITACESMLSSPDSQIWHVDPGSCHNTHIAALQYTIALAAPLRQFASSLAVVELPAVPSAPHPAASSSPAHTGFADIIDRLGRHLVSTADGKLTSVIHFSVPENSRGLDTIIDTLPLGDVDSTIYIDADGRFDPHRSHSRADIDEETESRRRTFLQTLDLASRAGDKSAIFGDVELTDAERRALDDVDELRPRLATPHK